MAIVVETRVTKATREQADACDAGVEAAMMGSGGPPDGLMVHFARPEGDGFRLSNVWRSEADMRPFYDAVILPRRSDLGLEHDEPEVSQVWVFARP